MKIKHISILLIGLVLFSKLQAQYVSKLSSFGESGQFYNPANTGHDGNLSASLGAKEQWAGLKGAPSTQYFLISTILKNKSIAVGFSVINDRIGLYRNTSSVLSYAYRIKINKGTLAFGLNGGIQGSVYKTQDVLTTQSGDPYYNTIAPLKISPQFGAGIKYNLKSLSIGISLPSLNKGLSPNNLINQIGYKLTLSKKSQLTFNALNKLEFNNGHSQTEFGMGYIWNKKLLVGMGIRQHGEINLGIGVKPTKKWLLLYSYDYISGNLKGSFAGSHEILLKYNLVEIIKSTSPRDF